MRNLSFWATVFLLVYPFQVAAPQMGNLPSPAASRRVQTLERRSSIEQNPSALNPPRASAAELAAQAAEISQLGTLIRQEIDQFSLSSRSELAAKLKKVEKLSKQLRSQVEANSVR
jgi:hypothetical protein